MVIFGATGDLTKRLLAPALYNLSRAGLLPEDFALIGVARAQETAESWREAQFKALKDHLGADSIDEAAWKRLADKMSYVRGDLTKPELYEALGGAAGCRASAEG